MKVTIKRIKEVGQNLIYPEFHERIIRKFSPYFTLLFLKGGISANLVSFFSVFIGIAGAIPLFYNNKYLWFSLPISIILATILDHSDGEVARWNKNSSLTGLFIDRLYPIIVQPIQFIAILSACFSSITDKYYFLMISLILIWLINLPRILNAYTYLCVFDGFYRPKKAGVSRNNDAFLLYPENFKMDSISNVIIYGGKNTLKDKLLYLILFFAVKPIGTSIVMVFLISLEILDIFIFSFNPLTIFILGFTIFYLVSSIGSIYSIIKNKTPDNYYSNITKSIK